ncbi:hypothetical protein QOZ80_3AG0234670 [Eleusine coracana subsp. coracana]|nr:hypothetical protein QOZ80_3AG0234670 [Eleusine coracana subsp. coracana]
MGKAGRWLRSFLSGRKDRPGPAPTPREKRWSFRRPVSAAGKLATAAETPAADMEFEQKKHAVATAAAADAARLSSRRAYLPASLVEDAAAVKIQATFRGYLARTALCALRGIVKLQALVRGQLVRKQANATLRCMQALLAAQTQLRMRVLHQEHHQHHSRPRHPRHRRSYEMDRSCEEHAKIVEVDTGEPARRGRGGNDRQQLLYAEYQYQYNHGRCSPAVTEPVSPTRAYSGHLDEFSVATAQSSPQNCPSYMANTESSRAKQARSQSAPRQRTHDALHRQPSRRKQGTPPRSSSSSSAAVRMMQRSASLASPAPGWWSAAGGVRLDASLKDSECGSTSSVLTAATVYSRTRSLVGFEVRRGMY